MRVYSILLSLCLVLTVVVVGIDTPAHASTDEAWLTGLVLTKGSKVARNAAVIVRDVDGNKVTLHDGYGDEVTDMTTDSTGNFTVTYFPISSEPYSVIMKHGGETYRFSMVVDDTGHNGHHALLFRLAEIESEAIDLNDEYDYYRAGMRRTDSEGKVIYLETSIPDTDNPYTSLFSYHVDTGKVLRMKGLMKKLGSIQRDSVDFSVDGRHVAEADEQEIKIWHVTTLERQLKRTLDGNEYFANSTSFGGDYDIEWLDDECVRAAVYQADPDVPTYEEREFLEYRTYCL